MPEGRPIVADCGSETYAICEYIDYFLKPLANKHEAYIKDTYDFVQKIRNLKVSKDALICTADVSSLYPNMIIDRSLEVVREAFEKTPDPNRPDTEVLKLLEISLRRNESVFADNFYRQVCGTAMGKRYAPSLADLYLIKLDHCAKYGFKIKPLIYFRYLDDIFFIWEGTRTERNEYLEYLNTIIPNITLTCNIKSTHNEFLDVTVYKDNLEDDFFLLTTVFLRPRTPTNFYIVAPPIPSTHAEAF
jgi:hypothetical protein